MQNKIHMPIFLGYSFTDKVAKNCLNLIKLTVLKSQIFTIFKIPFFLNLDNFLCPMGEIEDYFAHCFPRLKVFKWTLQGPIMHTFGKMSGLVTIKNKGYSILWDPIFYVNNSC